MSQRVGHMKKNFTAWMIYGILGLFSLACVIPVVVILSASLSDEIQLAREGYSILPRGFTFTAYETILKQPMQMLDAYAVSIFVTVVGTLLSVFVSSMLAYPISRRDFKYRSRISFYIFFTMLFNGGLVPYYIVVSQYLHLRDSIWVLILPGIASAFFVLLLRTFFATIPYEIIESARIDGVGEYRMFFQIVVPLSTPVLATVGLFCALNYWNDWFNAMLFIDNRHLVPLQYLLMSIMNNIEAMNLLPLKSTTSPPAETARMATAILAVGPMSFIYLFFQKYFTRGLTIGAIKG